LSDTPSGRAPGRDGPGPLARALWWTAAWLSLALGTIGVFVPGLPTVPFVLLAAFCASRGAPALRGRLDRHPSFGPMIRDFERSGAVSRSAKRLASLMMLLCSALLAWLASALAWALASACMAAVALWLWRRPEPETASAAEAESAVSNIDS
jgi:uncharacterized membrane protein YbaN (DUF454 family)